MLAPAACHGRGPAGTRPGRTRTEGQEAVAEAFDDTTGLRRIRSTVLLVVLLVVLGIIAAAGIGAAFVLLGSLLDQALE